MCLEWHVSQYQLIQTLTQVDGKVWVYRPGWRRHQREERLDGLLTGHQIIRMSRVEWFIVRPDYADVPNIYYRTYGAKEVLELDDGPIYDILEDHFRDYHGYTLSVNEQAKADAEVDEYREHVRRCAAKRGIRGL